MWLKGTNVASSRARLGRRAGRTGGIKAELLRGEGEDLALKEAARRALRFSDRRRVGEDIILCRKQASMRWGGFTCYKEVNRVV